MSNVRQRTKACKDLAMYFAEKGKELTSAEYINALDKPILFSNIRSIFRNYSRMVEMVKRQEPELMEFTVKKEQPKPAPVVPATPVVPKPAPVVPKAPKPEASVKPAVKPAVKLDKDDE
jgi:hypothetical protein